MDKNFEKAYEITLGLEGRYSNNPKDRGGPTMWGITQDTARAHGYKGDMRQLPIELAKEIYYKSYWLKVVTPTINNKAPKLARKLFDVGVNVGPRTAFRWLQMVLNSLNLQESKYADVVEDGLPGPRTNAAFETLMTWRGYAECETVLITGVSCLQGHHYIDLSRRRPEQEEFVYGWLKNRIL